jgi:molecular chaperone IbpA
MRLQLFHTRKRLIGSWSQNTQSANHATLNNHTEYIMYLFEQINKSFKISDLGHDSHPLYNIRKIDDTFKIEVSLAGYKIGDVDITVDNGVLIIASKGSTINSLGDYMHKGFSASKFNTKFTLQDTVEVKTADFSNGILTVWLEDLVKKSDKPKKIVITTQSAPKAADHPQLLNEDSSM